MDKFERGHAKRQKRSRPSGRGNEQLRGRGMSANRRHSDQRRISVKSVLAAIVLQRQDFIALQEFPGYLSRSTLWFGQT
jgi:hypothetical protein